ncbi:MAG: hypothetical protein NT062_33325 [Proteobacteria bacterium]|nr:hypothetical protein [Pseudomonadota bacterium]
MRSVLLLTLIAAAAAWAVVSHLPESEAVADSSLATVVSMAPQGMAPQGVRSVALDGRGLPLAAMRAALATKVGTTLDRDQLAADRATLQHMLETRGFLHAKVDAPSVTFSGNGAYVLFAIERGPEFHVRDVKLVGVSERDVGMVTIGAWDVANPDRIERVRQALEASILSASPVRTRHVTADVTTDLAASAVDVVFTVAN